MAKIPLAKYKLKFQHTAARRRLHLSLRDISSLSCFNTQPRGGGCRMTATTATFTHCFNTQPRGGGCSWLFYFPPLRRVSTHSRAEAAALSLFVSNKPFLSFNTQPRGGGCRQAISQAYNKRGFNTQPRGGGCELTQQ